MGIIIAGEMNAILAFIREFDPFWRKLYILLDMATKNVKISDSVSVKRNKCNVLIKYE